MSADGELIVPASSHRVLRERLAELGPVTNARTQQGDVVVVARRVLLQSPIWHSARLARKHISTSWLWDEGNGVRRGISTINNEPIEGRPHGENTLKTGGLLRFIDLDLMLALAYHWQETGQTQIDVDQETVLNWIGYPRLEDPPYLDLRAAITRIQATQIRLFEDTGANEPVSMRILPSLLLESTSYKEGRRNRLRADLGEGWLSEFRRENQIISLRTYLPLVRCIREADQRAHRGEAPGLPDGARLILLFLDAFRTKFNQSKVKIAWLHDRYGDRKVSVPDLQRVSSAQLNNGSIVNAAASVAGFAGLPPPPSGKFRYLDPLNPNGLLYRSLKLFADAGIISAWEHSGDMLDVRWRDPKDLPMPVIAQRTTHQAKIFHVDKFTGNVIETEVDRLPAPEMEADESKTPEKPGHTRVPVQTPAPETTVPNATASPPRIVDQTAQQTTASPAGIRRKAAFEQLIKRFLPRFKAPAWEDVQLGLLIATALYHHHRAPLPGSSEHVKLPIKFITARTRTDSPASWTREGMTTQGFDWQAIVSWIDDPKEMEQTVALHGLPTV